jgi:hypothetical protein
MHKLRKEAFLLLAEPVLEIRKAVQEAEKVIVFLKLKGTLTREILPLVFFIKTRPPIP